MESTLRTIERRRRSELNRLADRIGKAQHSLDLLRAERDARLRDWHADGSSVELLANAAGLTRQGVYDAIARARKSG